MVHSKPLLKFVQAKRPFFPWVCETTPLPDGFQWPTGIEKASVWKFSGDIA
jgi:hypothetical protein